MALAHFLLEDDSSNSLARQRVLQDRLNPLDVYNEIEFRTRYRVTKCMFFLLEEKLLTFLNRSTIRSHPIASSTQLAAALAERYVLRKSQVSKHHLGVCK